MCKLVLLKMTISQAHVVDYYYYATAGGAKIWVGFSDPWKECKEDLLTFLVEEVPHFSPNYSVHH